MNITKERIADPAHSYRFLQLDLAALGGQRHQHAELELTWIESSSGLRFVGDSVAPFGPGDLVLVGPHLPHAWISARRRSGLRHTARVLQFAPSLLDAGRWPEMRAAADLPRLARGGLSFTGPAHEALTQAMARMPTGGGLRGLAGVLEIIDLLVQQAPDMATLASAASRASAAPERADRAARVVEWVRAHLAEPLTVAAAARVAHVSPGAFSRWFAREVGKSFARYVNDLRCSEACLRLRTSDRSVAQVAQDCGFTTLSHFNRQFRLRHGLTPREFRRGS